MIDNLNDLEPQKIVGFGEFLAISDFCLEKSVKYSKMNN